MLGDTSRRKQKRQTICQPRIDVDALLPTTPALFTGGSSPLMRRTTEAAAAATAAAGLYVPLVIDVYRTPAE